MTVTSQTTPSTTTVNGVSTTTGAPPLGKACLANFFCTLDCRTGYQTDATGCPLCVCNADIEIFTQGNKIMISMQEWKCHITPPPPRKKCHTCNWFNHVIASFNIFYFVYSSSSGFIYVSGSVDYCAYCQFQFSRRGSKFCLSGDFWLYEAMHERLPCRFPGLSAVWMYSVNKYQPCHCVLWVRHDVYVNIFEMVVSVIHYKCEEIK